MRLKRLCFLAFAKGSTKRKTNLIKGETIKKIKIAKIIYKITPTIDNKTSSTKTSSFVSINSLRLPLK